MFKKSLCLVIVCSLLLSCVCCSSSSDQTDHTKRYTYDDLSYSVPASWKSDISDPDVTFMQYSDDENQLVMATKYEASDFSAGKLFDHLNEDGVEYEESVIDLGSGNTIRGAIYYNDDDWLVAVYPFVASSGDEYRLTIIQKELDADAIVAVLTSVEVK